MRIALWNEPLLDYFARSAEALAQHLKIEVSRQSRRACRDRIVKGTADIALVPTLSLYKESDLYDALPAVAISSWQNPYLSLLLKAELGTGVSTVAIDPAFPQEALIAKILLKEHYAASPRFLPIENLSAPDLSRTEADAAVLVSAASTDQPQDRGHVDLGQDWFELTHYPMVWGVFVLRKGEAETKAVNALRDIARYTELYRQEWLEEESIPEPFYTFFNEKLRYRLDDLAVASLTSFQDYLYYNEAVEEMTPVPFFEVDPSEDDDEDQPLL